MGAGADDAHEADSGAGFTSTFLTVYVDSNSAAGSRHNGGFRFTSVTIAQGSTIDVAYLTVVFPVAVEDSIAADILMEDVDNAVSFVTNADVTSRVRTASSALWSASNLGQSPVNSPSIVTPVQAVINRAGFVSGNAVVALIDGITTPNQFTSIRSYDGSSTNAAKLHIEYTAGGAARRVFVIS